MKEQTFVSVVVRLQNNASILEEFLAELEGILGPRYTDYEIILVDDNSRDLEAPKLENLLKRYDFIRYLRLSRSFGKEISVYAGMRAAIGDYIATLSIELDSPFLIPGALERTKHHGGITYGVCKNIINEGAAFKLTKSIFAWIAVHLLKIPLSKDAATIMVFSRRALNAILEIKDYYQHIRLLTAYVGYTQESFPYEQVARSGVNVQHRSLFNGIAVGIRIIFANSALPLRLASLLSMAVSTIGLCYAMGAAGLRLFDHSGSLPGPSIQVAAMFFFMSLVLVIMAEHIGCLIEESRNRPLYYILEEKTSSVIFAGDNRRNVMTPHR